MGSLAEGHNFIATFWGLFRFAAVMPVEDDDLPYVHRLAPEENTELAIEPTTAIMLSRIRTPRFSMWAAPLTSLECNRSSALLLDFSITRSERQTFEWLHSLSQERQSRAPHTQELFIDLGAHIGLRASFAALLGYNVIAAEASDTRFSRLKLGLLANGVHVLDGRSVRHSVAATEDPTAVIHHATVVSNVSSSSANVPASATVDELVLPSLYALLDANRSVHVRAMRVGVKASVLQGASRLLELFPPASIVVRIWRPAVSESDSMTRADSVEAFHLLLHHGYKLCTTFIDGSLWRIPESERVYREGASDASELWRLVVMMFEPSVLLHGIPSRLDLEWEHRASPGHCPHVLVGETLSRHVRTAAMPIRTAVLIPGLLRFSSQQHLDEFKRLTHPYQRDMYVSTYEHQAQLCRTLTPNCLFVDANSSQFRIFQSNMFQWWHLSRILNEYGSTLRTYRVLVRIRTDQTLRSDAFGWAFHEIASGIRDDAIYAESDMLFLAHSIYFLRVFSNFSVTMTEEYWDRDSAYFPINYANLARSDLTAVRAEFLNTPKLLWPGDANLFPRFATIAECGSWWSSRFSCHPDTAASIYIPRAVEEHAELLQALNDGARKQAPSLPLISFAPWIANPNLPRNPFGSEKYFALHTLKFGPVFTAVGHRVRTEVCADYSRLRLHRHQYNFSV